VTSRIHLKLQFGTEKKKKGSLDAAGWSNKGTIPVVRRKDPDGERKNLDW